MSHSTQNIAQNRLNNFFPLTLQTITIALMMPIWGKWGLCSDDVYWSRGRREHQATYSLRSSPVVLSMR